MRILVTGGTGFVGSWAVRALVEAGHSLRLLARDPAKVKGLEAVGGDVTDPASVGRAVEGCEAVLHCGSLYSFDPRRSAELRTTNVRGTEVVLNAARAAGCDPIVHISSYVGLLPAPGALTADSPPQDSGFTYAQSKADSERIARKLQEQGAPVVCIYPGWVWGPDDERIGEASQMLIDLLRGTMRVAPPGRGGIVDVRDLARVISRCFEPGRGARRYLATATAVDFRELIDLISTVTGRKLSVAVMAPKLAPVVLLGGAVADGLRRIGLRLPATREGAWVFIQGSQFDDGPTWTELGVARTPLETTVTDQIRWLTEHGRLTASQAGKLGG